MGGWGEARGPSPEALADKLASAVRAFDANPTSENRERMMKAAKAYEASMRGDDGTILGVMR